MDMRLIGIVLFTIIALLLITVLRTVGRKITGEDKRGESQLEQSLKERENKAREEQDKLREDPLNISGEKVLLRPVSILDKKPLSVILNDKRVGAPVGMPHIKRVSEMEKIIRDEYLDTIGIYSILALSSMRVIGLAKLLYSEKDDEMDTTLFISRQYWRHGLGEDTARALINNARKRGCKRLVTRLEIVDEKNSALLNKLGFSKEDDTFVLELK